MLGLQRGTVEVVAYTPMWASLFQEERARLQRGLSSLALDIQHVGSTSVPGLAAKPILDVGVAIRSEADVTACVPILTALGYTYRGDRGWSEGHFFDQGSEDCLTHYLHVLLSESPGWKNYLLFRDYLTAHPQVRDDYMRLKQTLAIQFASERAAYTASKAEFVQRILAAAQAEANASH